jgi:hypothetical protein
MEPALIPLKKGQFYEIYEKTDSDFVLEDKTKRGLEVREHGYDDKYGVDSEKGIIYDIDGIGHRIAIRWYFPKAKYSLQRVSEIAEELESKYKSIREMTCPDDQ